MFSGKELLQLITAFTGSAGFAFAFNFRRKKHILTAAFGGFLGWFCYLLIFHSFSNGYLAGYLSTVAVSFYASFAARVLRTPATGLLTVSSIPMIPGASLYRCMHHLMLSELEQFHSQGLHTVLFASSMAAGFVTAAMVVHLFQSRTRK